MFNNLDNILTHFIHQVIYDLLNKLHSSKYNEDGTIMPESLWQIVQQTKHMLEEKDICISIFGQHNCGKSTFLNALIGEE